MPPHGDSTCPTEIRLIPRPSLPATAIYFVRARMLCSPGLGVVARLGLAEADLGGGSPAIMGENGADGRIWVGLVGPVGPLPTSRDQ